MKKYLFILVFPLLLAVPNTFVVAQPQDAVSPGVQDAQTPCTGNLCLQNPLGNISTPQALIGRIINSILGVVGSIALLMFVYGGLIWMTSSGSPEKIKHGRDILLWSAIGLAVIFSAYGLTRFILITIAQ